MNGSETDPTRKGARRSSLLGLAGALWALFVYSFRRTVLAPRTILVVIIFLFPWLLGALRFLLNWHDSPREIENGFLEAYAGLCFFVYPMIIMPLVCIFYGAGVVADEVEGRTITYLFTRPMPKWGVLLSKFCAVYLWIGILVSVSMLGTFILFRAGISPERLEWKPPAAAPAGPMAEMLAETPFSPGDLPPEAQRMMGGEDKHQQRCNWIARLMTWGRLHELVCFLLLGAAFYTAIYTFVGMAFPRPMIVSIIYAFPVQLLITLLSSGRARYLAAGFHVQALVQYRVTLPERPLKFLWLVTSVDVALGILVFGTLAFLVLGMVWLTRKEYVLKQ